MRPLQQYYEFMGVSLHCHNLTIQSQGNVRCVVRHDGTLVESNEYYPYGGLFSATASVQPYKYGSKELDRTNGLDLYDSEARWYDSLLGRTTTMDPLAEKYYSLSPYLWSAGNPVRFVDPDGNVIVFINGMHISSGGKSDYWNGVDNTIKEQLKDYSARYYDGSCGGALNTITTGYFANNINPNKRMASGYLAGLRDAKDIYNNLKEGETIKIATHSMGAAFGKGFILGLQSYAKNNGFDHRVEMELDLAPFQSLAQCGNSNVETTITISHWKDVIAGPSFMLNATNYRTRLWNFSISPTAEHSINSFQDEIEKFVPVGNANKGGLPQTWEEKNNK